MTFTNSAALVLLLLIPLVVYIGWPRHRFRRLRDTASLLLRTTIIVLVVLGLAGAQIVQSADKLSVIFLVDVSDSMGTATRDAQLEYIRDAAADKRPNDEFGIILFGATAIPERTLSPLTEVTRLDSDPVRTGTDFASAINLALGMFPSDTARRIVVLSDGVPTQGDTLKAAELAAATDVEISYVTFSREPAPEVQLTRVSTPETVIEGQDFDLAVTIEASDDTPATLNVYSGGNQLFDEDVDLDLRAGTNSYTFTLDAPSTGPQSFRVLVKAGQEADRFDENNRLAAFSNVVGPPRVLVVSTSQPGDAQDEGQHLVSALEEAGLAVDRVTPGTLPIGIQPLIQYESIVLTNVPARRLSNTQMENLESFVKDLGGGLVVIGGPESYGPGFYMMTPLEEALPVDMQIRDQQRLPQLTIAYLIDRSGSMSSVSTLDTPNIELAKKAIIDSLEFLQPTDRAAVASFDTQGYLLAPFQDVLERLALQRQVATLRAGGGTDILAGMELIARDIVQEESDRKHIILLTDGGANPRGLVPLAERLYNQESVTTSVIAIGQGAADFLEDMAEAGGGHYHHVIDVGSIPSIFTQETVLASRSYIIEEAFQPRLTASHPIMDGITQMPRLQGYIATTPKVAAQVVLSGPEPFSDPLLATWQYGLGRSVAFTSDASARWASDWVTWQDFSRFWSQVVQWTMSESSSNIETRVQRQDGQARITVDARDDAGDFLNSLDLRASLLAPDNDRRTIPLRQVAPGRYEASFAPQEEGAYFLTVSDMQNRYRQVSGWVMSYSAEYNMGETDDRLLREMAALTDGRSLAETPDDVFSHNIEARNASSPIWPWLLLAAAILLPVDVAMRRLIITRSDVRRLREWLGGGREAAESMSGRISSLRLARERARRQTGHGEADVPAGATRTVRTLRDRVKAAQGDTEQPETTPEEGPRYRQPPPSPASKQEEDETVAGRLLKWRKEREQD